MKFIIIGVLFLLLGENGLNAALRTASVSGNWNNQATWGGAAVPTSSDDVVINSGITVTVNVAAQCQSLSFVAGIGGTVTVNSGITLAVTNAVTLQNAANATVNASIAGQGTLICAALNVGDGIAALTSNNSTHTHTLTSTINSLTINTNLSINSYFAFNKIQRNGIFIQTIGTLTINGSIVTSNQNIDNISTFTLGNTNPTLTLGGEIPFTTSSTGTSTITLNGTGATVSYNRTNTQTVRPAFYTNLTLAGTNAKTTTGVTVNGVLSMEGTATASVAPTYGTGATLQYKGSSIQTTGSEFPATFNGTGGVIIDNGSSVTLGAAKTIGTASKLILTDGRLTTTTTNLLSITNTAITSITGGSTASFINGPVRWSLPASLPSGSTYNFPIGMSTTYLPFALVNPTTGTGTVTAQVEAFNSDAGGTSDATLNSKSNTEYWSFTPSGNFTNATVSVSRPSTISPLNVISGSATLTGQYTNLGGTSGIYGVTSSNAIGAANRFFVLAAKMTIAITTGTITGSPFSVGNAVSVPFTVPDGFVSGNIFTAQLSNSSGSFASPVNIGTLNSTTSGTINATIPSNSQNGNGYRIRVISSSPVVTGTDNGRNLTVNGGTPFIIATPISLTSFTYPVGYGPSAEQSFTVSGINLLGNILLTPSVNFEISTGSGASFVASSLITLQVSGGVVSSTTIRVRMKAGHALGAVVAENISCESTGAITASVSCNGTVITAPEITTSVITESFSYTFGSGPSASKTFTVNGTYLGGSVVITPPANYEISSNGGTNYQSSAITLALSSGNAATYTGVLNTTTITVRLKTALGTGSYSENVVATSTSAVSKNVALSGTVTASATIYNAISSLSGFIYTLGNGPSGFQSFVVKASALTDNVIVTPPAANFEISKDSVNFQSMQLTLLRNGTTLTADTIVYVRMKSGISVIGTYGPVNSSIVLTSAGAITKSVACKGEVVDTKKILVSKNTLTGFGYKYSASPVGGPSSPQSFTVSGALLTGNVVITAPTNYEISKKSSSGYSSTISLTGTTVNPTIIYVRLKSGLPAADYGTLAVPLNLTVASSGATTINVFCIGKVFASPLIAAGGGGSFCEGSTINLISTGSDIQSFYWTGPNNYYLSTQNPVLTTNATASLSGTYTVNGSVVVGGNLITNGDFEAGNTSFSSGYGYVAPSATALNPEGMYTIVNLPGAVHSDFTNHPDHTSGTGLQMVVNGSPTAGVVVWSQSVPVIPGATYQFTYSEQTVNITQVPKNASQLQLYVNGVAAGPVYTAPLVNYQWATFMYNASAGINTVLNLELINQNTIVSGNDFSLDDIVFQQILPATASTVITVNPIVPVSISIAASPGTSVYSNTPVTFTATPTNGGTTPAYQWKVNGVNVGSNSTTYNYIPLQGDVVTCTLTSSLTCVTNNPATATLNMTVTYRVNYWMGYIDTDWGKQENWTANYVPLTGDDVEYATVANFGTSAMRDLWLDMNRTIGSLINATTKRLVIPAAKGLTVNNTVNTDGNADRIYIYSSSTLANGSLSFKNIESMPVSATVEMYSKASWDLTKPINNKYKWQYFGIPLRSVKAEPTFYGSYVRKWYETGTTIQNHWIELSNESILQPFYGYEICQESPKTVIFKGQLVNKDFNSGQLAITSTALYPGQHIFANPYTAAIDIRQLTFGTGTQATIYLYNTGTFTIWGNDGGFTSGTNAGQYVAIPNNLAGSTGLPRQVPSMQAMLVKAQNVSSDAYFGINYNAVIMNNTDLQRVKGIDEVSDKVCTRIDVKGKHFSDKMWIFTEPGCSNNFDNGWDGFKFLGSAVAPQIFAKEHDGDYQVTTVGDMNNSSIYFQGGEDTEYTLTFTNSNLERYYQNVYLVDLIENKTVEITNSRTEYKFSSESTPKALNRFNIVTRPYERDASDLNSQVKIFNAGKTVFIHNFSNVDGELMIYDISGRSLKKATFTANGVTAINTNYISGGYIVRAKTNLEEISKRIILR